MLTPGTQEIRALVGKLGGRRRQSVEAAMGRLAMVGNRAVDALIEALEGDDSRVRARAMQLLALIQDTRAREPLAAMLLDHDARLRAAAALALGRFPHPHSVAALGRVLERDRSERVKVATVQALLALHSGGQDAAVAPVLEALADAASSKPVRLAALELLPLLSAPQRRSILDRLENDPHAELREAARDASARSDRESRGTTRDWIARLGSRDYAEWNEAVRRLGALGDEAIQPLLAEMQTRAHDPELCTRAGMALKAMGPRRAPAIARGLERFDDPLPLLVLVEVIGALGDRPSVYRLKTLIERLDAGRHGADGFDVLERVGARAHLELARVGSRVAAENLRQALTDPGRRVEPELVAAAELIGQGDEIGALLDAWVHEDDPVRGRIGHVVRVIMKRERMRRNSRLFNSMSPQRQAALRSVLTRSATLAPGRLVESCPSA